MLEFSLSIWRKLGFGKYYVSTYDYLQWQISFERLFPNYSKLGENHFAAFSYLEHSFAIYDLLNCSTRVRVTVCKPV